MPTALAYLVSHPIQYQAPLLKRISAEPDIRLSVIYLSDRSAGRYSDPGFGINVEWDSDLLSGYEYRVICPDDAKPSLDSREWSRSQQVKAIATLRRVLREGRYDALWVHGYRSPVMFAGVLAAKQLGIRVLIRGESQIETTTAHSLPSRMLRRVALPRIFRLGDAFLAVGTRNKAFYRSNGVPAERIFLMPYAVDNAFFRTGAIAARPGRAALLRDLNLEPHRPVILSVGKLIDIKRPHDLLAAYAAVAGGTGEEARASLVFVGDGPGRGTLEREVAQRGLSAVRVTGFRNQRELPRFYDLCDVFVLPSAFEPWGLAVNEAMNAARPVVVSDASGCADDLVVEGSTGFTFPAGDVGALARTVGALLQSPELARTMGDAALGHISGWDFEADVIGLRAALASSVGQPASA